MARGKRRPDEGEQDEERDEAQPAHADDALHAREHAREHDSPHQK